MKTNYIGLFAALLLSVTVSAQITQVTDINTTGDSGIGSPYFWNESVYFEADQGLGLDDELYVYGKDSSYLLMDINTDTAASSTNSDPKLFIEFKDKLYFSANAGKGTSSAPLPYKELFVTDGSTEGTHMVYDFAPAYNGQGNPQQMFVYNDKLYMQINDGSSTQLWSYDGTNEPIKISYAGNQGYFTPSFPLVDTDKVWLKGNDTASKGQLYTLKDDVFTQLTENSVKAAYGGKGIIFNGGLLFQGISDEDDSELWFSNGTKEGTILVKDINTSDSSDPEEFTLLNDKVYFVASVDGKTQLWASDASAEGTQAVYAPATINDAELENLIILGNKLYFSSLEDDGSYSLNVFDGSTTATVATIGDAPEGFIIVEDLIFFIADEQLWYSAGYAEATGMVESDVEYFSATDEYTRDGSVLYFTADDANGHDDIYAIDASSIEHAPVSIPENKIGAEDVTLSPMPTSGTVTIGSKETFTSYKVYSLGMRLVKSSTLEGTVINLSLPAGMYILQLQNSESSFSQQIIIR